MPKNPTTPVDPDKLASAISRVQEQAKAVKAKAEKEAQERLKAAEHEASVLSRWAGFQNDMQTARTRLAEAQGRYDELTSPAYIEKVVASVGSSAAYGNAFSAPLLDEILAVQAYGPAMLTAAKRTTVDSVDKSLQALIQSDGDILRRHGFID